jgi:hypothetical protein
LALKIACPLRTTVVVAPGVTGGTAIPVEGVVLAGGKVGDTENFDELLIAATE